jgi:hypothetical protein
VIALVLDVLDGYVARLQATHQSRLGADLDSLADVVSFGVAPAVLGYTLALRGLWDVLCLTYFVCCGISRLARFNVTAGALTNSPMVTRHSGYRCKACAPVFFPRPSAYRSLPRCAPPQFSGRHNHRMRRPWQRASRYDRSARRS